MAVTMECGDECLLVDGSRPSGANAAAGSTPVAEVFKLEALMAADIDLHATCLLSAGGARRQIARCEACSSPTRHARVSPAGTRRAMPEKHTRVVRVFLTSPSWHQDGEKQEHEHRRGVEDDRQRHRHQAVAVA